MSGVRRCQANQYIIKEVIELIICAEKMWHASLIERMNLCERQNQIQLRHVRQLKFQFDDCIFSIILSCQKRASPFHLDVMSFDLPKSSQKTSGRSITF